MTQRRNNNKYGSENSSLKNSEQWKRQNPSRTGNFGNDSSLGSSTSSRGYQVSYQEGRQKYWSDTDTGESITSSVRGFLDKKVDEGKLHRIEVKGKKYDDEGNRKDRVLYHTNDETGNHVIAGRKVPLGVPSEKVSYGQTHFKVGGHRGVEEPNVNNWLEKKGAQSVLHEVAAEYSKPKSNRTYSYTASEEKVKEDNQKIDEGWNAYVEDLRNTQNTYYKYNLK